MCTKKYHDRLNKDVQFCIDIKHAEEYVKLFP